MDDLISLFPAGSTLDEGMLTVGGCRADELADEFGALGALAGVVRVEAVPAHRS